jgi:hypothetical protein
MTDMEFDNSTEEARHCQKGSSAESSSNDAFISSNYSEIFHEENLKSSEDQNKNTLTVRKCTHQLVSNILTDHQSKQNGIKRKLEHDREGETKRKYLSWASQSADATNAPFNNLGKFFSSIDSLEEILPMDDCRFLGEQLWIFTIQQLSHVIDADLSNQSCIEVEDLSSALIKKYGNQDTITDVKRGWKNSIVKWMSTIDRNKQRPRTKFSLSGSISCLTSPSLLQFLSQQKIYTAFDFLAMKKTEGSDLVVKLNDWRKKLGVESKLQFR